MEKGQEFAILTDDISRAEEPEGLEEDHKVAQRGGRIAGNARRELEQETGRPVATAENAQKLVTGVMEGAAALTERTDDAEGEKG